MILICLMNVLLPDSPVPTHKNRNILTHAPFNYEKYCMIFCSPVWIRFFLNPDHALASKTQFWTSKKFKSDFVFVKGLIQHTVFLSYEKAYLKFYMFRIRVFFPGSGSDFFSESASGSAKNPDLIRKNLLVLSRQDPDVEPSRGEVRYLIWIPKTALKREREKNVPVSGTGYSFRLRFK